MASMAMKETSLGEAGLIIKNITLFAVLVYELVGPMLTKMALLRAGDIKPEEKTSARHEHLKKKAEEAAKKKQSHHQH